MTHVIAGVNLENIMLSERGQFPKATTKMILFSIAWKSKRFIGPISNFLNHNFWGMGTEICCFVFLGFGHKNLFFCLSFLWLWCHQWGGKWNACLQSPSSNADFMYHAVEFWTLVAGICVSELPSAGCMWLCKWTLCLTTSLECVMKVMCKWAYMFHGRIK